MSEIDPRRLEPGTKVLFRQGDWRSSLFQAEAEVVGDAGRTEVPIKITKILKGGDDIYWWKYQVGTEVNALIGELSKPR